MSAVIGLFPVGRPAEGEEARFVGICVDGEDLGPAEASDREAAAAEGWKIKMRP